MRHFIIRSLFPFLFLFFGSGQVVLATGAEVSQSCPVVSYQTFEKSHPADGEIVFFASWCTDCRSSLETAHLKANKKVYLVAIYDTQARAELVAQKFAPSIPCFTSDGSFEKSLKIDHVPFILAYKGKF